MRAHRKLMSRLSRLIRLTDSTPPFYPTPPGSLVQPVLTKSVTLFFISMLSDGLAQWLERRKKEKAGVSVCVDPAATPTLARRHIPTLAPSSAVTTHRHREQPHTSPRTWQTAHRTATASLHLSSLALSAGTSL